MGYFLRVGEQSINGRRLRAILALATSSGERNAVELSFDFHIVRYDVSTI
jgi:hypothetical protein